MSIGNADGKLEAIFLKQNMKSPPRQKTDIFVRATVQAIADSYMIGCL